MVSQAPRRVPGIRDEGLSVGLTPPVLWCAGGLCRSAARKLLSINYLKSASRQGVWHIPICNLTYFPKGYGNPFNSFQCQPQRRTGLRASLSE